MKSKAENKKNKKYNFETIDLCILEIMYLFYYSYRYIFRFNSTTTSITYRNTPIYLQLLKYILVCIIIFHLAVKNKFQLYVARRNIWIFLSIILLVSHQIFFLGGYHSTSSFKFIIAILPILFFLSDKYTIYIDPLIKIFDIFFVFATIYEALQIVLYITEGRLPALAYGTGMLTDVRFGGAWDDPNGYAVLLSFYVPYIFSKYKGFKRVFLEMICLTMELLCWSGTGYISTGLSCVLVFLLKNQDTQNKGKFWLFSAVLLFCITIIYLLNKGFINDNISYYLHAKKGSVQAHAEGWNLKGLSILTVLGLKVESHSTEIGYLVLLLSGGIFDIILFVGIFIEVIRRLVKQLEISEFHLNALTAGCLGYSFAMLIASFNLPLFYSFSNMGMLSLIFSISTSKLVQ